jgi:hypothetical protein
MSASRPEMISVPADCLLVFLDETGHERMPNVHTYYGAGGCAALMRDYDRTIVQPWRAFRELVTGSPTTPLHAADFGRAAAPAQLDAFAQVFRTNPFMRIGAVGAVTTAMPEDESFRQSLANIHDEEHLAFVVLRGLQKRIVDVAKWTAFRSAAIIFEQNPRSRRLVQSAFAGFGIEENGTRLPVEFYDMPKSAGETGLEVADFVANTIASHARRHLVDRKSGFGKDFQAVFQSVDEKLASFMAITSVGFTPAPSASA